MNNLGQLLKKKLTVHTQVNSPVAIASTVETLDSGIFDVFNKTDTMVEFTADALVLSCTLHNIRKQGRDITNVHNIKLDPIYSLIDNRLPALVTDFDREEANQIRDYYSKKLLMWMLKERPLTSFRKDLNKFLQGSPTNFLETLVPIVYRLPEFYHYDIEYTDMVKSLTSKVETDFVEKLHPEILTLTPIRKFRVNKRSKKHDEYWFKDSSNHAFKTAIEIDNILHGLWDNMFNNGNMVLKAQLRRRSREGFKHYEMTKISLA